jgi:hypothetical protein
MQHGSIWMWPSGFGGFQSGIPAKSIGAQFPPCQAAMEPLLPFNRTSIPVTIKFAAPGHRDTSHRLSERRFFQWQIRRRLKTSWNVKRSSAPPARRPLPKPSAPPRAAQTRRRLRSSCVACRSAKASLIQVLGPALLVPVRRFKQLRLNASTSRSQAQSPSCTLPLSTRLNEENCAAKPTARM